MQAFARETRFSETTFVQAATVEGADYRNRIWTMGGELDFAGHPSLGTAVAVAFERGLDEASFVQQTRAGLQPVRVRRTGEHRAEASMVQSPVVLGELVDPAEVARAAGLAVEDLDPALPAQVASTGHAHLLAIVRDAAVLARVRPSFGALAALLARTACTVLYLVAVDGERAQARSFFVDPGELTEDPATGSAAGPLLGYLAACRDIVRCTVEQGIEMGRPSLLESVVVPGGIEVRGETVVVARGRLIG
jgi:trans-2,3-dihydro-3-hydroxyanthranilate isomerase